MSAAPPRTLVVGAGAVGCFIAARLTVAGWPCRILARGESLAALRTRPLSLADPEGDLRVRVHAVATPREDGPAHLILVAVKRDATEQVAASLLDGALARDGVVLSLQNGIDNAAALAPVAGPERTGGVAVYVGVRRDGPGRIVRLSGRGGGAARRDRLVGGPPGPVADALIALAGAAGLDVEIVDDPRVALWRKLVANTALNTVTALGRSRIGPILDDPGATALMRALGEEAVAVARAAGVDLDPDTAGRYLADIRTRLAPDFGSSTLFDLEAGRSLEHDALVGAVVREGERHGVSVPHARACDAMLRLVDPGGR